MAGLLTGPASSGLQAFAIPAVVLLILFLGYSSQWLFATADSLNPGPLTRTQARIFNALLICLWWTYYRACSISPGSYALASASDSDSATATTTATDKKNKTTTKDDVKPDPAAAADPAVRIARWCKKCDAPKPPRAHHCKHCGRCIPKMDHHCPWTGNCVSMTSFPHFLRLLVFANVSLWMLSYLIILRLVAIWHDRLLPYYLGPSPAALAHLVLLWLADMGASLALGILLYTTVRGWVTNTTMIEGWEVERHEAVLGRYAKPSWWSGADRSEADAILRLSKIEFPYDIGFFRNMAQAMGTANPLAWFFPLSGSPAIAPGGKGAGWLWEENGFNEREGLWPPPDPEKLRRARAGGWPGADKSRARGGAGAGFDEKEWETPEAIKAAVKERQERDLQRWKEKTAAAAENEIQTTDILQELEDLGEYEVEDEDEEEGGILEQGVDGEPGWTNSDGDRLGDYGVDEDEEEGDDMAQVLAAQDEDVPLGELLRRRKVLQKDGGDEDED